MAWYSRVKRLWAAFVVMAGGWCRKMASDEGLQIYRRIVLDKICSYARRICEDKTGR